MKKALRIMGFVFIGSGTLATFGNYLWLVGLSAKPEGSLMEARWIYSFCVAVIGGYCFLASSEVKEE